MNEVTDIKPLQEAFGTARSILVVVPGAANLDVMAGALGLFTALKEAGKSVIVASDSQAKVEFSRLVGIDQLTGKLGNRNLVISFDYIQDAIEKVSYNVEGKKFNLVIQPKEGGRSLDPTNVSYAYEGSDAQIIFVVGAKSLAELGNVYLTEKAVFDKAMIVNIDTQPGNSRYGQVNVVDNLNPSVAQLVARLIIDLGLELSADSATNLMQGLEAATQKFQHPGVGADTFEMAANLLRSGASRQAQESKQQQAAADQFGQVLEQLRPAAKLPPLEPAEEVPVASPDWLKPPKIYSGSTRI